MPTIDGTILKSVEKNNFIEVDLVNETGVISKLSCFKDDLFAKLVEGAELRLGYVEKGRFRNIISIEDLPLHNTPDSSQQYQDSDKLLKSTCLLIAGFKTDNMAAMIKGAKKLYKEVKEDEFL